MNDVALYGREVKVRSRYWCGLFHDTMHEVCACEPDGTCTIIGVFDTIDEALKYIVNAGHRVRNGTELLLAAIAEYQRLREIDEMIKEFNNCVM